MVNREDLHAVLINVNKLIKDGNKQDLYVLKRSYGSSYKEASMRAKAVFYKLMPSNIVYDLDSWFVCVTMAVYQGESFGTHKFEELVSTLVQKYPTAETKFNMLLDSDKDEVFWDILFSLVGMMKIRSTSELINIEALLFDLLRWNKDNDVIPQRWGRKVYGSFTESE